MLVRHDNYMYKSCDRGPVVRCKNCGKIHKYFSGEMVYKVQGFGTQYKFCSYSCRAKFKRENPEKINPGYVR